MKEHGTLFRQEMILALLNTKVGSWPAEPIDPGKPFKWQTRRPVADENIHHKIIRCDDGKYYDADCINPGREIPCKWRNGDVLWVKETFLYRAQKKAVIYKADLDPVESAGVGAMYGGWKPSIFLPRAFCRLELELMADPIHQRVNEINEGDAKAEGVMLSHLRTGAYVKGQAHRVEFRELWDSIHGKYPSSFLAGPWVWALVFKRIK